MRMANKPNSKRKSPKRWRAWRGFVLCAALAGACGDDRGADDGAGSGWTSFGRDQAHSRSNPAESEITVETVGSLELAWEVDAPGVTSTPIVHEGVVYWSDWSGGIHASDLADGAMRWSVEYPEGEKSGSSGTPTLLDGALYVVTRAGTVMRLDAANGDIAWETSIEAGDHILVYSSPTVVDGLLIIGVCGNGSSQDGVSLDLAILETFHGSVQAFDTETGAQRWAFDTTLFEGQQYGPGVGVWSTATVDTERGIAYIGTGNGYDAPVSPLSDSLLALDYRTGEYVWHTQYTADDAFRRGVPDTGPDADVGAAPNLFEIDGRAVVGVGDKGGVYRVHDRQDGELVWEKSIRPGYFIGGIMAPAALHDGTLYVASNNGADNTSNYTFALDASTGDRLWQVSTFGTRGFGAPTYAGGVVYGGDSGTSEGGTVPDASTMYAFDAADGSELWSEQLPGGRGGGITVVDGTLLVGHGYHFQVPSAMPVVGGLRAYRPKP